MRDVINESGGTYVAREESFLASFDNSSQRAFRVRYLFSLGNKVSYDIFQLQSMILVTIELMPPM